MLFVYIVEALLTAGFASSYPGIMPPKNGKRPKNAGSMLRHNKMRFVNCSGIITRIFRIHNQWKLRER